MPSTTRRTTAAAALEVNAFGVRSLAQAAARIDATLVHYGTDFVFDGTASEPYREDDAPNPQSVYAASKLLGDWFAQGARAYVLRVESLFGGEAPAPGAGGRRLGGSLDRIADALLEGREVRAFVDRVVSPSHVEDGRHGHGRAAAGRAGARVVPLRRVRARHLARRGGGAGGRAGRGACHPRHHPGRAEPARSAPPVLRAVEPQARRRRHRDAALAGRGRAVRASSSRVPSMTDSLEVKVLYPA